MLYDLSKQIDVQRLRDRLNIAKDKKQVVEFTVKKPNRSLSQNAYLHLIIGYWSNETGYRREYTKQRIFKQHCNPDLFVYEVTNRFTGEVTLELKSSSVLDTTQMKLAIDRFRNWAVMESGIYLPEPNEEQFLQDIEIELSKNKEFN